MRLDILNHGYGPGTKLLFALIRLFSGHPVPDAAKLVFYRPDFYGTQAKDFTHAAMRGPSAWSVGDRELMAAYVSQVNESAFCIGAHTATAGQAYQDGAKVRAVLADLESAPIEDERASRPEPSTCSSGVTGSWFSRPWRVLFERPRQARMRVTLSSQIVWSPVWPPSSKLSAACSVVRLAVNRYEKRRTDVVSSIPRLIACIYGS